MQITFNPREIDLAEATVLLGMIVPGFIKGCRAQGDSQEEVIAGLGEVVSGCWAALDTAEKDT